MKIENIIISDINVEENKSILTFDIIELTDKVNVFLKINDREFFLISESQEQGTVIFEITKLPKGVNNLILKMKNDTEEYISEPFVAILKNDPSIENFECIYSDSTGKYILEFNLFGDELFKYNISVKLDENEYQEVMTNQLIGKKRIEGMSTMGTHTYSMKITDGYDEYETETYTFEITNQKPILSKVLVTDVMNSGTANIHYAVKDIENSTLTHTLNLNGVDEIINPIRTDNFYSYNITNLSVGNYVCTIKITDGIDIVETDEFSIEIFTDTEDKKEILRQSKIKYDNAYLGLKEIVTSVVADGVFNYDIEHMIIQKAKDNYNIEYSNFNKTIQQSIDIIGTNKVKVNKEELRKEIDDVDSALNTLENTMETTFRDGILDESERALLRDNLNIIAKEKADVDKDYETLYNNEDLLDPAKTKLKTKYDIFTEAQNSLALTINTIIEKETIIDNNDKANIDIAFENWRNALGEYRNASLEAIDSIAKKKVDDKTEILNKQWSDLIVDLDGIRMEVGTLEEKVSQMDENVNTSIQSVEIMYYLSNSTTVLEGGTWQSTAPTWEQGKYMWSKTVTTLADGRQTESSPVCIAGAKGQDGTSVRILGSFATLEELNSAHPSGNEKGDGYVVGFDLYVWDGSLFINVGQIKGQDGVDGTTYYTWIRYSDYSDGTGMYEVPNENTKYIGIAVNQTSPTPSTNKTNYAWSRFRGEDGQDGQDGQDGKDGSDAIPSYTWVKYADDENGSGMTDDPTDKKYIGFAYNKPTDVESNNPKDYSWVLFKGEDGLDATPSYTWIKYADDENGNGLSNDPKDKEYIGFAYNKKEATESTNPTDYKWSLIKGMDGLDATPTYTWIRYSDNVDGSGLYDIPNDDTQYIGIATNKTEKTESTNPSDYVWSKFRGADGVQGKDGKNFYTWIRYANDSVGNGISNDPINKKYIGFAYNKETATESNNPIDYKWSLMKGIDGVDGIDGIDGVDGTTYYTWIRYADYPDGSNMYNVPTNNTKFIGIAINKITPVESDDKNEYTWSKFRGDDGIDGTDGIDGIDGVGVQNITEQYYLSTSKTSLVDGSWLTTCPDWVKGKYLWTRSKIEYTDGTVEYTEPICDSSWEVVDELADEVKTVTERVAKVEVENDSITSTVSTLTSTVNSNTTKISEQASKITQLDNSITSTVSSVNSLNTKVNSQSSQISQLSSSISSTVTTVNSLNNQVSTNTSKITQLSNKITSTVMTEDDIKSIIEQSPDEIRFGFNDISDYVAISSTGLTVTKGAISCDMITNYSSNAIIRLFKGNGLDMAIDATSAYETGVGDAIRLKRDNANYVFVGNKNIAFYCAGSGDDESAVVSFSGATSNNYLRINSKGGNLELNNGRAYMNSVELSDVNHTHLQYSLTTHTHSDYAKSSHTHNNYANSSHTHSDYANSSHTHSGYAKSSHTHSYYGNGSDAYFSNCRPSSKSSGYCGSPYNNYWYGLAGENLWYSWYSDSLSVSSLSFDNEEEREKKNKDALKMFFGNFQEIVNNKGVLVSAFDTESESSRVMNEMYNNIFVENEDGIVFAQMGALSSNQTSCLSLLVQENESLRNEIEDLTTRISILEAKISNNK